MDLSNARLLFAEEFDTAIHPTDAGWRTTYHWGDRYLNAEQQIYTDEAYAPGTDPFLVEDGVLTITARPAPADMPVPDGFDWGPDETYTSGLLNSGALFSVQYGYFEIKAKMPAGQGLWPAIWLLESDGGWPSEYDIVEVLGHDPTTTHATSHFTQDGANRMLHASYDGFDSSDGFHTYGFDWNEETVTWYYDGEVVFEAPNTVSDQTMYLLINLAVGGDWPGGPDATTPFPAEMQIDYVRIYQHAPDAPPAPMPHDWAPIGMDAFASPDGMTTDPTWDFRTYLEDGQVGARMMHDWSNIIIGNELDNLIKGGEGPYNELDGRGGDDIYRGRGGLDVFVVRDGDGNDRILDFSNGPGNTDKLRLEGFHFDHFDDLAPFMEETPDGTIIRLDKDQAVFLDGVAIGDLAPEQFVFVDSVDDPVGASKSALGATVPEAKGPCLAPGQIAMATAATSDIVASTFEVDDHSLSDWIV